MAEAGERTVCDLTRIVRLRLLCGLYNRRALPPRLRGFARTYCLVPAVAFCIFITFRPSHVPTVLWFFWYINLFQYFISYCVSHCTGDEYIYTYFTTNSMTDITLDSSVIFNCFQKNINLSCIITSLIYLSYTSAAVGLWYKWGIILVVKLIIPTIVLELLVACSGTTKMLVMGLFNSRMLVMRRRLERYGFRTVGCAPPQPYCRVFDEIWRGLDAMNSPLKIMLLFDLVVSIVKIILITLIGILEFEREDTTLLEFTVNIVLILLIMFKYIVSSFAHVAFLESAAAHCESMAVFTATQLIKTPSYSERRRMYDLLHALERRGARYSVLRALPLDANLVLRMLGFCSAQVLVFINMIKTSY